MSQSQKRKNPSQHRPRSQGKASPSPQPSPDAGDAPDASSEAGQGGAPGARQDPPESVYDGLEGAAANVGDDGAGRDDDGLGPEPGAPPEGPTGPAYVVTEGHRAAAAGVVWTLGKGLQQVAGVQLQEATRAEGVEKIAPVLAKRGIEGPEWFQRLQQQWAEEIAAGMWLGGILWQVYQLHQAEQRRQAEEAKEGKGDHREKATGSGTDETGGGSSSPGEEGGAS